MIDLDQLSAFIAISEGGTVTAAARKLHRTQSAISRRLALLEDALNARLFDRRAAKLALTDCGRAFLPFAESALAAIASGRAAVQQQLEPNRGSVSVAIVGTLVEMQLAQALRQLPNAHVGVSVLTAASADVSRLVRQGRAHLGVRYFEDDDPELVCTRLGVERMLVVASPQHRSALAAPRWIGFPLRTAKEDLGRLLHQQLTAAGMSSTEVMVVDSISAQKRLVEVGLGIALLPETSVRDELERGVLVSLDLERVTTAIEIHLVHRRAGYLSPAARNLITLLKRTFAQRRPITPTKRRR
jgi:DNA-binding transcriptional LysR family regulator